MKNDMNDERMQELYKKIDAQIELREKQVSYGPDRRRGKGQPPAGQEERRQCIDRRGRARGKDNE